VHGALPGKRYSYAERYPRRNPRPNAQAILTAAGAAGTVLAIFFAAVSAYR
jgi:hypothetical protein